MALLMLGLGLTGCSDCLPELCEGPPTEGSECPCSVECSTDYAVGTCSSGGSFGDIGDTRKMIFSISNIQNEEVCGLITVIIVKPDTDYILTTIPESSATIDICGFSVPTNNGDWDILDLGSLIYLTSTVDITEESVVEVQFECIDYKLNETPQIIGSVVMDSGGDSNPYNNTWQQPLVLN